MLSLGYIFLLSFQRHQIMIQISWLNYIPGPHQKLRKHFNELSAILREIVNEHKNTRDPTFARDLIDGYLDELEKVREGLWTSVGICTMHAQRPM